MAEEQGLEVSIDGFNKCMDQQRERSRVSLNLAFSDCSLRVLQNAMDSPGGNTLHPTLCKTCQSRKKQQKTVSDLVPKRTHDCSCLAEH